jgi:type I restriction enzyme M protein
VKTGVLVFRKPLTPSPAGAGEGRGEGRGGKSNQRGDDRKVWFCEIKNDGFDPDKIVQGGRPETPDKNDIPGVLATWADYRQSNFTKPPGVKAGELLPPGSDEPKSWWASVSVLAENDYNLAAGRYKPQVGEKPPEEDPAKLINATLKLEREIASGLEKLLKEVEAAK